MFKQFTLVAEKRELGKKSINNQLRKKGRVPVVAYGQEFENVHLHVDAKELYQILHSATGMNSFIEIKVNDDALGVFFAKEVVSDPIRPVLLHIDFEKITEGREMNFMIPVELTGSAKGVRVGGIVEELFRELEVRCLPKNLIDHIKIDVSDLDVNQHVSISDIDARYENLEFTADPKTVIVTVSAPRTEEEEGDEEEDGSVEPEVIHGGETE